MVQHRRRGRRGQARRPTEAEVRAKNKEKKKGTKDRGKKDKKDGKDNLASLVLDDAGDGRASSSVAKAVSRRLDMETASPSWGHLQRGGIPTPFDRVLATRFGTYAAEMLAQGMYNHMVCMKAPKCRPSRSNWSRARRSWSPRPSADPDSPAAWAPTLEIELPEHANSRT